MSSECWCRSLVWILLGCLPVTSGALGDEIVLEARPVTCIALHRGQTCYKRIRLSWSPLGEGAWCLLASREDEPLACWSGDAYRDWSHDYAASDAVRYRLVRHGIDSTPGEEIAAASVKTAWVYRGSRRSSSGWRLF